jgi:hypothetical protein
MEKNKFLNEEINENSDEENLNYENELEDENFTNTDLFENNNDYLKIYDALKEFIIEKDLTLCEYMSVRDIENFLKKFL